MKILKTILLNNNYTISYFLNGNNSFLLLSNQNNKLLLKFILNSYIVFRDKKLWFLNDQLRYSNYLLYLDFIEKSIKEIFYKNYNFFGKLHMIGLGFKNFILNQNLYILVGDCNYIVLKIPESLKVFCKKNQVFVLSSSNTELFDFISNIKKIKKSNFYKGKGILEFKNFKFMKLKVGKKQRFM